MKLTRTENFSLDAAEIERRLDAALTAREFQRAAPAYVRGVQGMSLITLSPKSYYRTITYSIAPAGEGQSKLYLAQEVQTMGQVLARADKRVIQGEFDDIVDYVKDLTDNRESRLAEYAGRTTATTKFFIFVFILVLAVAGGATVISLSAGLIAGLVALVLCMIFWSRAT